MKLVPLLVKDPMFSTGQMWFALAFSIVFILVIIYAYRGDTLLHKKYYKGVKWVVVGFLLFILSLFALKFILNK